MYHSLALRFKPRGMCCRHISSNVKNDVLKVPKYPEILDDSPKAVAKREKLAKHKRIEALKTVEEKLFALNMDKYYGWKCYILNEGVYPLNFLPFAKHITRTNLMETDKNTFHNAQGLNLEESQELLSRVRPHLQEALLFELNANKETNDGSDGQLELSKSVINKINSTLLTYFSSHYPHLLQSMVDFDPRVEAFWSVGGFYPSPEVYSQRKKKKELSETEWEEPVDHWIQHIGKSVAQVRSTLPLPTLDTTVFGEREPSLTVTSFPYDPTLTFGIEQQRRFGTNIPGFWPGDRNEFVLFSYNLTNHLSERPPDFGEKDRKETTHAQAILSSFSSLLAQASYQGFSTFSELTYPFVTQSILTDGRLFSFYLYQLNTTLLHSDHTEKNPRVNNCLALPAAPLYQEIKGGEFVGWNDDVLSSLLSCYLNRPRSREGVELKPYLDKEEMHLADISDPERRKWLEAQFKHMYTNRPRNFLPYEIYDWERIYKIKFETRLTEARKRPFELDSDPLEDRKYYEHAHPYIPRAQRSRKKHWTNWRAKMAKTYYPEI